MLRTQLRIDKRYLRRLFESLQKLRNEYQVSLTELPLSSSQPSSAPTPQFPNAKETTRKWESVEQIQQVAMTDDNEPSLRVFEQTVQPPTLLKTPLAELLRQIGKDETKEKIWKSTKILDTATGLEKAVTSTEGLNEGDLYLLRRFTSALTFTSHSPLRASKDVFYWLQRSNDRILKLFTPYAWKLMWALEVSEIPSFRSTLIGDKMVSAGIPLSEEQEIAYIGGLFWNKRRDEALQRWQNYISQHGGASPAFWNLGVRMYSLDLQPVEAEKAIWRMLKALGYIDTKTWIPVIMCYNHTYQAGKAWHCYELMRRWAKKNGEPIKVRQYDDICMSFLDNAEPAMGLEIYKHMAYSGHKALKRMQTETYENLSPAIREAQNLADDPDKLNNLSFDALESLPPKVRDKYFYGGWIKNLIRMGRTDLANYLVRDVMMKNGELPDAIHLNWIIQGYLQENNLPMAESLAIEMIRERLKYVQAKQPTSEPEFSPWAVGETPEIPALSPEDGENPQTSCLPVAPATIQTFSLLFHYYARRQRFDKTVELSNLMSACGIPPNSYIVNHLIFALFRRHDMASITSTYHSLIVPGKVIPDLVTLQILWLASWRRYTRNIRKYSDFPSPRELFRLTLQYFSTLPKIDPKHPRLAQMVQSQIELIQELFHKILKSFLLSWDLPGVLVALHTLYHLWPVRIKKSLIKQVVITLLIKNRWNPKNKGERPRFMSKEVKEGMMGIWQLTKMLKRARKRKIAIGMCRRRRRIVNDIARMVMKKWGKGMGLEGLTVLIRGDMGPRPQTVEMLRSAKEEMAVREKLPGLGM